jgi:NADH-quinone oxidoreductase subunit M
MTLENWALFLLIAIPFSGGISLAFFPSGSHKLIHRFAVSVSALSFLLTLYIFFNYDRSQGGFQFAREIDWLPLLGISFTLGVDGISVAMVLLTGIVFMTGVLVSKNITHRPKDFFALYLLLVAGVFGVFESQDLFFFFFFYELAVVPMYLLIGVWGSTTDFGTFFRSKEYGAMKLMLYLVAGSMLVWIAILAVYAQAPDPLQDASFLFTFLEAAHSRYSIDFQRFIFPMFMVGFGILAGLWPFHTWSPDGHVAAPTAVSMVHAGVLMKLGAYGIIRTMSILPEGAEDWMFPLILLGTANVLYGAISAMAQKDLKYVVGYSSVSHMGYVFMGIATLDHLGVGGAVLQMFSHGIMTALFFALVGFIYDRTHIRDIHILQGLAKRMGVTASFFAVAGMTSLGLPGLSGFVAEVLVFIGLFRTYPLLGVLGIVGAAITAIYILRLLAKVFFGPLDKQWQKLSDAAPLEGTAAAMLVLTLLLVGVYPTYLITLIDSSVKVFLTPFGGA